MLIRLNIITKYYLSLLKNFLKVFIKKIFFSIVALNHWVKNGDKRFKIVVFLMG